MFYIIEHFIRVFDTMQQLIFNNFPVNPIVIKLRFIKSYQLDNFAENVAGQQPLPNERT